MKRSQWLLCGLSVGLCFSQNSFADLLAVQIEPIVGYERVQQLLPTPHSVNRLIYGARVSAGLMMISGEAEYTHGVLQEDFPDLSQTSASDRLKVGLRSGMGLGSLINLSIRGGVQASMTQTAQTVSGVTTTHYTPLRYDPYAGATVRAKLGKNFNATVSVVAVIRDINHMEDNEYQTTAGLAISFP
ncbi:MAG: hypothetical protein ABIQ95_01560 [Bdellovibrionia bacterium]